MRCFDASSLGIKLAVAVFLSGCCISARAQFPQTPPSPTVSRPPGAPGASPAASDDNDQDIMARRAMIRQAQKRNEERQQDIVKDTAKLLTLTRQLQEDLAKNHKDPTSLAMIKKTEEIEKLAKSVKEKMKGN